MGKRGPPPAPSREARRAMAGEDDEARPIARPPGSCAGEARASCAWLWEV